MGRGDISLLVRCPPGCQSSDSRSSTSANYFSLVAECLHKTFAIIFIRGARVCLHINGRIIQVASPPRVLFSLAGTFINILAEFLLLAGLLPLHSLTLSVV